MRRTLAALLVPLTLVVSSAPAFGQFATPPNKPAATPVVTQPAKPAPAALIEVAVGSVTLGDECGNDVPAPKAAATTNGSSGSSARATPPPGAPAPDKVGSMQEPAAVPPPADVVSAQRGDVAPQICRQSAIVLMIKSKSKATQTIELTKVELLDHNGTVLGTMAPRHPTMWKTVKRSGSYKPWDLKVARGKSVQARWWLSAPPWKSPQQAHRGLGKGYRVNVTVTVNGQATSVSGNVNYVEVMSPPTILEPGMVT